MHTYTYIQDRISHREHFKSINLLISYIHKFNTTTTANNNHSNNNIHTNVNTINRHMASSRTGSATRSTSSPYYSLELKSLNTHKLTNNHNYCLQRRK